MSHFNYTPWISNDTNPFLYCQTPRNFATLSEFFACYKYFASLSLLSTVFQIFLFTGTILANLLVFVLLAFKPSKNVYDKILLGHSKYFSLYFIILYSQAEKNKKKNLFGKILFTFVY